MLKLFRNIKTEEVVQPIDVPVANYTKEQINDLFALGKFTPVLFYKSKAKKLFDLGLSFDDSKYLLRTRNFTVNEIVKCIGTLKLDVNIIRALICSKETFLSEIPNIMSLVGSVENLRVLTQYQLSIANIKTLFNQLRLTYNDSVALIKCGYKIDEIETLIKAKFSCVQLVSLANIITVTNVCSLFKEDKQNLIFLLSVINVLKREIKDIDSALDCYQIIYDSIPNNLYKSLINCSVKFYPDGTEKEHESTNLNPNREYEEILKYYMDLAGGSFPMTVEINDAFVAVEKIIKFFRPYDCEFIDEYIPIKPFILAAIWLALDMSLGKQYFENMESINNESISRFVLSFLISSMCGVTGYFHSGGVGLPFPNITNYIKTYFNIQCTIKQNASKVYGKIPRFLKFNINETFEDLIKEKQKDAGRGLSMVYTFRVGNAFLCSLLEKSVFSRETAQNIFRSLWPLPQESESIRMYLIYSGIPIYTRLNLKDVFVLIP